MSEVLLVYALRDWLERDGAASGWASALREPQLAAAIAAIHRTPAEAWSVARLARMTAMSRTRLHERFVAATGHPPMAYVAEVRVAKAERWLASTERSIAEIASLVGYESSAAFQRTFKRLRGRGPGAFRATTRARHRSFELHVIDHAPSRGSSAAAPDPGGG